MPLFFLGTREWRNRQTRTVQVRVPVMEWGFNSPLAHDETADPSGSAVFVFPSCGGGVVAPVFSFCLWSHGCSGRRRVRAALCARGRRPAREPSALRAFGSARRLEARPGPATAHGHGGRSLRRPPHRRRCVAGVCLCVGSKPGQAPCLEAFPILSFACNSLTPAVRHLVKSLEFQRLHFKA